jgi:radical SAM superfamily enzyme YgiQ (UPF0313 family)
MKPMQTETAGKYHFETGIYRPPSEGGSASLLIRVTRNCPWNKCAFCGMYKQKKFALRSPEEVKGDIDAIASLCLDLKAISEELNDGGVVTREVIRILFQREPSLNSSPGVVMVLDWLYSGGKTAFLQDANSLMMRTENLVEIIEHLRHTFPSLVRVTSYARSKTLARKSEEELGLIHQSGLDRLHVGLETGDETLLKRIKKGATPRDHILGGKKAMAAGFQLSEYWMPGLGGKAMWKAHAVNTARVLNQINPDYIRSRPFFPHPGTPMSTDFENGEFQPLTPREQLVELRWMISELNVTSRVCFDHAGNHWRGKNGARLFSLSYEGYKFPEEKDRVLEFIEEGLKVPNGSAQSIPPGVVRL